MARRAIPVLLILAVVSAALFAWFALQVTPETSPSVAAMESGSESARGPEAVPIAPPLAEIAESLPPARVEASPRGAQAAPPVESSRATLSGRVVASDGASLAGASIGVHERPEEWRAFRAFVLWPLRGEAIASVRTDETGSFRLAGLPSGKPLLAQARAAGHLEKTVEVEPLGKEEVRTLEEIRLAREGAIEGTVVDADGTPLGGARISIEPPGAADLFAGRRLLFRQAESDASGRYRLEGLEAGEYRVVASVPGREEARSGKVQLEEGETETGLDFRLGRGLSIGGRVAARDGRSVEGAEVRAFPEGGEAGPGRFARVIRAEPTRTDADGRFVVGGLTEGDHRVEVHAEGFVRAHHAPVRAGTEDLAVSLDPMGTIAGRVAHSPTGTPVAEVEVRADREGEAIPLGWWESVRTGTDGSFSLSVDPGLYRVRVSGRGYAEGSAGPFAVSSGGVVEAGTILVQAGSELLVRVVRRSDGEPIEGARVEASSLEESGRESFFPGPARRSVERMVRRFGNRGRWEGARRGPTTSAEGKAELKGLTPGRYEVSVEAEGFAPDRREIFVAAGSPAEMEVGLSGGGAIHGRAWRSDGRPYAGAEIAVRGSGADLLPGETRTADAEGRFRVENLVPGEYRVSLARGGPLGMIAAGAAAIAIRVEGGNPAERAEGVRVVVAEGEAVEVELREPAKGTVSGRVTEAGTSVAGVQVRLHREGSPIALPLLAEHATSTDFDGRFRFEDVEAGRWLVRAEKPGALVPAEETIEVSAGTTLVEVALPLGGIGGRVVEAGSGRGVPGAEVLVEKSSGSDSLPGMQIATNAYMVTGTDGGSSRTSFRIGGSERARTDPEGRFRLDGIPPGIYRLVVSARGFAEARREGIEIARDERRTGVEVLLETGGSIRGRVLDAAGSAVPFVMVTARRGEEPPRRAVAGLGGEFEIGGLPAGEFLLEARRPALGPAGASSTVRVEPGRETAADLRLP